MLPIRELPRTGVVTSAVGFGCAGLFRIPQRSRRREVLEAAYDVGIRHFDVAPMYGLGLAEAELGSFLKRRRRRDRHYEVRDRSHVPDQIARSFPETAAGVPRQASRRRRGIEGCGEGSSLRTIRAAPLLLPRLPLPLRTGWPGAKPADTGHGLHRHLPAARSRWRSHYGSS